MEALFDQTSEECLAQLEELRALEPIFHNAAFGTTVEHFAERMTPEYWEVGASGRRYSREFILRMYSVAPVTADAAGWQASNFACRRLSEDTFLLTYRLDQSGRLTRRTTLWRRSGPPGWQVLFHQGTVLQVEEDDVAPPQNSANLPS
jgi:hypothetical protein